MSTKANDKTSIQLDVWSDVACPWCWVGKRHLEQALHGFQQEASDVAVRIVWRSFELNPNAPLEPKGPVDYVDRLGKKYGVDRTQAQGFVDRMVEAGRAVGLELRLDRIRPSNTFNAHRLLRWARDFGAQEALAERLFSAYLNQGKSLNETSTLVTAAADVGLDPAEADELLTSDEFTSQVRDEQAKAHSIGVTGVPFFLLNGRLAVAGAQPAATLLRGLKQALEDPHQDEATG